MTLARQVDLEETGNGGGPSAHHSRNEEGHPSSATPDLQHQQQQHHQQQHSGGGHHQQVYSTLLAPRYIMRADLYNHKGELDDSSYDSGTFIMFFFCNRTISNCWTSAVFVFVVSFPSLLRKPLEFLFLGKVQFSTARWLIESHRLNFWLLCFLLLLTSIFELMGFCGL